MTRSLTHELLLVRVAERLGEISTATDHLLLTRWRVLGLCEYLLGSPDEEAERLCIEALKVFAQDGTGASTDQAFFRAGVAVTRATATAMGSSVLPSIAPAKREEVLAQLREYERPGSEAIQSALHALPSLRDRLRRPPAGELLAGVRHRLELVAELVADAGRSERERCRAAAAILYLDELHDAIPDALGPIGLLDDDFALRVVLDELSARTEDVRLHWTERISALWDDLPFLQGVQLNRDGEPVATTWLDRINSYISYSDVLDRRDKLLVLVQPSVACSPLHAILSLIGLVVLDSLTSSKDLLRLLRVGQVYEIDGKYHCKFKGISEDPDPRVRGCLTLCFRDDQTIYRKAAIAGRMIAVPERPLSAAKVFASEVPWDDAEPIQRFFNWPEAIGAASISTRIILVTTQQQAMEMFQGIKSNGVGLLDCGLVRCTGFTPSASVLAGGLVLVVPNLAVARQLVDQGIGVYAIVVDGYERLQRGRHDLPFLMKRVSPPSVIVWSFSGYYPTDSPTWLPEHRRFEVSPEDLTSILELDGDIDDSMAPSRASLWEAATGPGLTKVLVDPSTEELELLDAIKEFIEEVWQSSWLPEYWRYHLVSSATLLGSFATATPAYWSDIRDTAALWKTGFDEQCATFRPHIAEALEPIAKSHQRILEILDRISPERNTKADALLNFLVREAEEDWRLVCDRPEQAKLVVRFAHRSGAVGFEPTLLRDLGVCRACIVIGWRNVSFGRRLWAHTPRCVFALVSEGEGRNWDRVANQTRETRGASLLEAIGYQPSNPLRSPDPIMTEPVPHQGVHQDRAAPSRGEQPLVPCIFLWLADEPEGKILARDARVLIKIEDQAKAVGAYRLRPEDRVILGPGSARWSPADEFTEAVVNAVEALHPELVRDVKEWRRALLRLREDRQWSLQTFRSKLEEIGVARGLQTLENWLDLDQAAPIGPQHIHKELDAIWGLVANIYTRSSAADVAKACLRLRSLRSAAGRALLKLWKGRRVDLGVDEAQLNDLVERLRQEVQVHEVDTITYGCVPEAMLGWWITPDLAATFEVTETPSVHEGVEESISEDD